MSLSKCSFPLYINIILQDLMTLITLYTWGLWIAYSQFKMWFDIQFSTVIWYMYVSAYVAHAHVFASWCDSVQCRIVTGHPIFCTKHSVQDRLDAVSSTTCRGHQSSVLCNLLKCRSLGKCMPGVPSSNEWPLERWFRALIWEECDELSIHT